LVVIPYWWDKKIESVAQSIRLIRPEVELPARLLVGEPVPSERPNFKYVPDYYHPKRELFVPIEE